MKMQPRIRTFQSRDELSSAVAACVAHLSARAFAERGCFTVVFSGGSLMEILAPALVAEPLRSEINWSVWKVFWADERFVPHTSPESNYGNARRVLLGRVPVPRHRIYPVAHSSSATRAALDYEALLAKVLQPGSGRLPRFDLILLGVGEDGHTASLFPSHPVLEEKQRWAMPVFDAPKPPPTRITLTLPVINNARHVVFVACGPGKAPIVSQVLGADRLRRDLPAQRVRTSRGHVEWFLDREAVQNLNTRTF